MLNSIIRLFIMNYLAKVKTLIYIWRISGLHKLHLCSKVFIG